MFNAEALGDVARRDGHDTVRFDTVLPKLLTVVAREQTTTAVASRIAANFVLALGARAARVYLVEADGGSLGLAAFRGDDAAGLTTPPRMDGEDDLPALAATRLGIVQVEDVALQGAIAHEGVAVAIPLFAGTATIGAVSASFGDLALQDCAALSTLSSPLGAILDGARARSELTRLEEVARKRQERMALVIHELRQPLQLLLLSAGHLAKHSEGDEWRGLEVMRSGGRRLDALISDLGDASFLESGNFALRLATTDVVTLVATLAARVAPTALVSIDGDIPLMSVDPGRIEQILSNLLVNAQKYGLAEAALRVRVAQQGAVVVVSVTNEGRGIPEDERGLVFEPYYRGRDRRPEARGQGLGLAICRMLVEEHGGRIWTDGDSSHTRFCFSLPLPDSERRVSEIRARAAEPSAASVSRPARSGQ